MATSNANGQAAPGYVLRDPNRRRASHGPMPLPRDPLDPSALAVLIEADVIPRLLLAHPVSPMPRPTGAIIAFAEVERLAPLVLQAEADELIGHATAMLERGVDMETLLIDLLIPVARLLGEYWEQDRCDFVDVTMGLWRLQEVVHELSGRAPGVARRVPPRRALFASVPGDQHTFGTVVIEELFSRAGWATDRVIEAAMPTLIDRVADEWFDLVGLTASCDCHIAALPSMIRAMRGVSRNPELRIMVGGAVFNANPGLALRVGADATAADARLALSTAESLVDQKPRDARYG